MALHYKGFVGTVKVDIDSGQICGRVWGTRDVITFKSPTVAGITAEFHRSVDDYLAWCKELGQEPDKTFDGNLSLQLSPKLHRAIYLETAKSSTPTNVWVEERLWEALGVEN